MHSDSLISGAQTNVADRPAGPVYAISTGGPLVTLQNTEGQPLTLSRIRTAVDAIESAESRANAVLHKATASLGKDGSSAFTRFVASRWKMAAAIGGAAVAAYGVYYFMGPTTADYKYNYYDGWMHRKAGTWWWTDLFKAGGAAIVTGAVTYLGATFGLDQAGKAAKLKMARGTLDATALDGLKGLHASASERPLERAGLGNVARRFIGTISEREIYRTKGALALLESIAADEGLGDDAGRAELERHRNLIKSMRDLTSGKGDAGEQVDALLSAVRKLTQDERATLAPELREALFVGEVPRRVDVPYEKANELRDALANA